MENNQIELGDLIKGRWHELRINPFTERISEKGKVNGNYVIFISKKPQYIGESKNLIKRINQHIKNMSTYLPNRKRRVIIKIRPEKNKERKEIEKKFILKLRPLGNVVNGFKDHKREEKELRDIIITNRDFAAARKLIKTELNNQHNLNNKELIILKMRFGLQGDEKKYTLQEIGEQFNITREGVRQIEVNALEKLKPHEKINYGKIDKKEKLSNLGISTRCINVLKYIEIQTLDDLEEYLDQRGMRGLVLREGFGFKCMSEIENLLEKVNA